jgi:hypothetical protein
MTKKLMALVVASLVFVGLVVACSLQYDEYFSVMSVPRFINGRLYENVPMYRRWQARKQFQEMHSWVRSHGGECWWDWEEELKKYSTEHFTCGVSR